MDAPHFRQLVLQAVEIVGSQPALARAIGKSQQHVSALCTKANFISAEDCLAIHRATGGTVPASALRPDLWTSPEHVPLPSGGDPARRPDGTAAETTAAPSLCAGQRATEPAA